jgi:glycosyltransferase involved in cell wall biosynthesis
MADSLNNTAGPFNVVFCFNTGRIRRLRQDTPDDFFYGFRHYARLNQSARLVEPHPDTQGLIDNDGNVYPLPPVLMRFCQKIKRTKLSPLTRIIQALFAGRELFGKADAVVAVTNTWIYAFSLLKRFGLLHCPVVGVAIGPFNPAAGPRDRLRNRLKRFLFHRAHLIFLGNADEASFLAHIDPAPVSTRVIYFGIDETYWSPAAAKEQKDPARRTVFAIGSAGRDYATLLTAWDRPDASLKIVTSLLKTDGQYPPGVEVIRGIWHDSALSDDDVRTLFREADFVVCPLHDTTQPCGQSATLQAMACNKAVILTRTSGLWDVENMRDGENCLLVEPGDVVALRAAIDRLMASPDDVDRLGDTARRTVIERYSALHFAERLQNTIDDVIRQAANR